jgi:hypothetical protein
VPQDRPLMRGAPARGDDATRAPEPRGRASMLNRRTTRATSVGRPRADQVQAWAECTCTRARRSSGKARLDPMTAPDIIPRPDAVPDDANDLLARDVNVLGTILRSQEMTRSNWSKNSGPSPRRSGGLSTKPKATRPGGRQPVRHSSIGHPSWISPRPICWSGPSRRTSTW